jgi:hypothetical protein
VALSDRLNIDCCLKNLEISGRRRQQAYATDARKCEWAVYEKALSEGLDDDPVHPLAARLFPPGAA